MQIQIFLKKEIDTKKIRNVITALLKSKEVEEIKRFNYIASYTLSEDSKKLHKEQEKSLLLFWIKNLEKVEVMIKKIIWDNYQMIK